MRKTLVISAMLFACVALNSCSKDPPEGKFIGAWKGMVDGESVTVRFMDQGVIVVAVGDDRKAGTWTVDETDAAEVCIRFAEAFEARAPIRMVA